MRAVTQCFAMMLVLMSAGAALATVLALPAAQMPSIAVAATTDNPSSAGESRLEDSADDTSTNIDRESRSRTSRLANRLVLRTVDYSESWRQTSGEPDRLGETLRSHQVRLSQDGVLRGRLTTTDPKTDQARVAGRMDIHFLREGKLVTSTELDETGKFAVSGLELGTYSIVGAGPGGLVAFAVHVHAAGDTSATMAGDIQILSSAVPLCDVPVVRARLNAYLATQPTAVETVEPQLDGIPAPVRSVDQEGVLATTLSEHLVHLQEDGATIGRIRYLHPETGRPIVARSIEVTFIQDGVVAGRTRTDHRGMFRTWTLTPGFYSLVATGAANESADGTENGLPHGFVAFSFHLLPADRSENAQKDESDQAGVAARSHDGTRLVSQIEPIPDFSPGLATHNQLVVGSPVNIPCGCCGSHECLEIDAACICAQDCLACPIIEEVVESVDECCDCMLDECGCTGDELGDGGGEADGGGEGFGMGGGLGGGGGGFGAGGGGGGGFFGGGELLGLLAAGGIAAAVAGGGLGGGGGGGGGRDNATPFMVR